jgi:hypothetical protein
VNSLFFEPSSAALMDVGFKSSSTLLEAWLFFEPSSATALVAAGFK